MFCVVSCRLCPHSYTLFHTLLTALKAHPSTSRRAQWGRTHTGPHLTRTQWVRLREWCVTTACYRLVEMVVDFLPLYSVQTTGGQINKCFNRRVLAIVHGCAINIMGIALLCCFLVLVPISPQRLCSCEAVQWSSGGRSGSCGCAVPYIAALPKRYRWESAITECSHQSVANVLLGLISRLING